MDISVIILAAGQGTRMRSQKSKLLHEVGGKPIIQHVLDKIRRLNPKQILLVCGHQAETMQQTCDNYPVTFVQQIQQLGTGHAVQQALPLLKKPSLVLIINGDVPMLSPNTLETFIGQCPQQAIGFLSACVKNPDGLGRVVRNESGRFEQIVEHKDASIEQKEINEINAGVYLIASETLQQLLPTLKNQNQQGEFYITDICLAGKKAGVDIYPHLIPNSAEIQGVNTRVDLAIVERMWQKQQAENLMVSGTTLIDPARFDLRGTLQAGQDVVIDVNTVWEGENQIGNYVTVGSNCFLKNVQIGDDVIIHPNSVLENVVIGSCCQVGPFARLRPGTVLKAGAKIGNFVETKNTTVGERSKVNHLSYLGDATLGKGVNIGAGTITCNYDGANKHRTTIEDSVFVGSNCELIAPVIIAKGATIAAGTTLVQNAPAEQLTLTYKHQQSVVGWKRPVKESKQPSTKNITSESLE